MVIFLTELNSSEAAVGFLQKYECERYDRYHRRLLFEENDREMQARIDEFIGE